MTRARILLASVIIPIQLALAFTMLYFQRDGDIKCKIATLGYSILCILEVVAAFLWFHKRCEQTTAKMSWAYRMKNHDVRNTLQILHTMAQMGKREQAMEFISNIGAEIDSIGNISRIRHTGTQSFLLELFCFFQERHIRASIDAPEELRLPYKSMSSLQNHARRVAMSIEIAEGDQEIKYVFDDSHVDILSVEGESRETWQRRHNRLDSKKGNFRCS